MKDRVNHRTHRVIWRFTKPSLTVGLWPRLLLCVLSGSILLGSGVPSSLARNQNHQPVAAEKRIRYQIHLSVDFDNRTYTGNERVRWTNRGNHSTSSLFFHLYSNVRAPGYVAPQAAPGEKQTSDEPRLEIVEIKSAKNDAMLPFSLDDQETTLRVNLREPIAPNSSTEIIIAFKGSVPEIDPEETGLITHVMQQVSAAIGSTRETRRAPNINFRCRAVMLLGSSYPVLAARDGDAWFRKLDPGIGDTLLTDTADYVVTVDAPSTVAVYTPMIARSLSTKDGINSSSFSAENLRDFAILAGTNMRAEERTIGDVTIRSIFRAEHEVAARRALNIAADAVRVYTERIGPLPIKMVSMVDAPLVATESSVEFAGFAAIASAFYLDFESPVMKNMPDLIREQRASVEDSLEWTVANVMAHQWWGASVGNDSAREPILDEA